jgi:hypothetical protein
LGDGHEVVLVVGACDALGFVPARRVVGHAGRGEGRPESRLARRRFVIDVVSVLRAEIPKAAPTGLDQVGFAAMNFPGLPGLLR